VTTSNQHSRWPARRSLTSSALKMETTDGVRPRIAGLANRSYWTQSLGLRSTSCDRRFCLRQLCQSQLSCDLVLVPAHSQLGTILTQHSMVAVKPVTDAAASTGAGQPEKRHEPLGHWRKIIFSQSSAQSGSSLFCGAETGMKRIVTSHGLRSGVDPPRSGPEAESSS
jgi:hypothetical protein